MIDLLGTTGDRDVGERRERNDFAPGNRNGQGREVLRPARQRLIAHNPQVDLVAPQEVVGRIRAIDQRIDRVP